jgi:hypothetical protein
MKFRARERMYSQVYFQGYALRHVLTGMLSGMLSKTDRRGIAALQMEKDGRTEKNERMIERSNDRMTGRQVLRRKVG